MRQRSQVCSTSLASSAISLPVADSDSWSKQGHLLASGSDDTYLNIWDYNPANLSKPFTLNTSVSTGHHANIFSVKFMPHSGDRTVVTCAGDSQVRVFDLEYGGSSQNAATDASFAASTRSRRFNSFFQHARWMNDGNTNARVYRSHGDRVKRVVTESSPHLFLTCSEDGEVRQWDLRMPSSAYPAPRSRWASRREDEGETGNVPPPLISYRKYGLDLNSISCSGSQPQYIALGGAHLHCFLHDRRMIGRDLTSERGQTAGSSPRAGTLEDAEMGEATRCVRRFAPNEKRKMGTHDHGHITACKISDANPNEMVVSWSGDHIYSFDIVKSPDARDAEAQKQAIFEASRIRDERDRKRKRGKTSSTSLAEQAKSSRRLRRVSDSRQEDGQTALRVRYENGETAEIPITADGQDAEAAAQAAHDTLLTEAQKASERVAKSLVRLRKTLFDFSTAMRGDGVQEAVELEHGSELTPYTSIFSNVLGQCSTLLPEMAEIIRLWTYPVDPSEDDVTLQNTLRRNRQATWRFVQAAGCLARTLGGRLQTASSGLEDSRISAFDTIMPAALERRSISDESRFCYDFLKAILLWIDRGPEAVLAGFKRPAGANKESPRFPFAESNTLDELPEKLKTYLHSIADDDKPLVDIDANRFERDATRVVFQSQKLAVTAFTRALAGFTLEPVRGNASDDVPASSNSAKRQILDKGAAARFWCVKIGRSLLMEAAEKVNFDFVNRAFGGLRLHVMPGDIEFERSQEDIDPDDDEAIVEAIDLVTRPTDAETTASRPDDSPNAAESSSASLHTAREATTGSSVPEVEMTPPSVYVEEADDDEEEDGDDERADDEDGENDGPDPDHLGSSSDSEGEEANFPIHPLFRRRVAFGRSRERASVNAQVPYSSHTHVYKGHCNTRTVKDVNYYGLDDEYVVSGSDDGHFFIWDRKTTAIVNILEGDGEVVNVVQGHPYEPMIACSGIDSTVKIFGVGAKEREDAEKGIDVANPGGSVHSSLRLGGRRARLARLNDEDDEVEDGGGEITSAGLRSRKAMGKMYEIISQNDVERRRGVGDAFMTVSVDAIFMRAWITSGLFLT